MTPPKRFRLTRNFAMLSAIVMVATALGLSFFYRSWAVHQMQAEAEQANVTAARLMANSLWNSNGDILQRLSSQSAETLAQQPEIAQLAEHVKTLVREASIIKVKIYDLSGHTIFSTDPSQIGEEEDDDGGVILARKGVVANEMAHANTMDAFEGKITDRDIISSYVPVHGKNGEIVGIFEIYDDVTAFVAAINHFTYWLIAVTVSVAIFANIILVLIVGRGDRLLQYQHEQSLELARTASRADAANKAKSEFLANMSHELRTPLNAVIGFSDLILRKTFGPLGDARYVDYARDINNAGQHLLSIINSILDLTKIELGRMQLQNSLVHPNVLIDEIVRMLEPLLAPRQISLEVDVKVDLSPLITDSAKLKQALLNLLSNAIKFSPDGAAIHLSCQLVAPRMYRFSVRDHGIGIAVADIPIALSPFGQVDSTLSRKFDGAGLGLPLAKHFTELMGGRLEIESALGKGTTVTVTIPDAEPALPLAVGA